MTAAVQSLWAAAIRSWWLRPEDSSRTQRKGNVRCWKPLPENWWRHSRLRILKRVLYWTAECDLAIALQLLVVMSCVYKWAINRIINPNPVYSYYNRYMCHVSFHICIKAHKEQWNIVKYIWSTVCITISFDCIFLGVYLLHAHCSLIFLDCLLLWPYSYLASGSF
jgi:hypothetical protein